MNLGEFLQRCGELNFGSWMQVVVREFLARLSLRYNKKFRKTTKNMS